MGHFRLPENLVAGLADAPAEIGFLTLRFVHYPGAQQLILWLPQSGYHGYGDVTLTRTGAVVDLAAVRDRLNGSVQILWDTLPWAPGDYVITITHADFRTIARHPAEHLPRSSRRASR